MPFIWSKPHSPVSLNPVGKTESNKLVAVVVELVVFRNLKPLAPQQRRTEETKFLLRSLGIG